MNKQDREILRLKLLKQAGVDLYDQIRMAPYYDTIVCGDFSKSCLGYGKLINPLNDSAPTN